MIEASDEKADGGYYSVICGLEHKTACFNKLAVTNPTGQITARNGSVAQRLSILSSKARKSPISRSSSRPSSRWSSTSRRQTGSYRDPAVVARYCRRGDRMKLANVCFWHKADI